MSEVNVGNIVVLIDPFTLHAVDTITYDALSKHVTVVTDIRELSDSHFGCEFVFFEPSVPAVVTPEILEEVCNIYSINPHLVYTLEEVRQLFEDNGRLHATKADFKILEWNLIYAVLNGDAAVLEPYQRTKLIAAEFATLLEGLPQELVNPVNRMYQSYLTLGTHLHSLIGKNAELEERLQAYKAIGNKTTEAIEELKRLLDNTVRQNRAYCAMLSESYDVTFTGLYSERPRTLYVKTISHLSGIDNLIALLYAVFTKQYKVSCKVVKLVDSTNPLAVSYVPNNYFPLTDTYNTYDVLKNDFMVSLGAYNILFNLLMLNRSGLDVLIVHDQRGVANDALDPSLVDLKINEMSSDIAVLNEYGNVLSDVEGHAQFVWDFRQVQKYTGTNSLKLANHPTIGKIMDYLL